MRKALRFIGRSTALLALVLSAFLVSASRTQAQATFVQTVEGTGSASFAVQPQVGNTIIAGCYSTTNLINNPVSDSEGNTYAPAAPGTNSGTSLGLFYAEVTSTGSDFTVSCPGWSSVIATEVEGIDNADPLATPGAAADTWSNEATTPSVSVSDNTLLVEFVGLDGGATITDDAGWNTILDGGTAWQLEATHRTTSAAESVNGYAKLSGFNSVRVALATFNLAGSTSDPTDPTVTFSAPSDNATVNGSIVVDVDAQSTDTATISSVELKIDGSSAATDTTAPYSFTVDTTTVPNGAHTLEATATTSSGATHTESIAINVDNAPLAPNVSLTSPVEGASVQGTVSLAADASTNDFFAVSNVQFYVDGQAFGAPDVTAPYSIDVDTTSLANGSHTFGAVATTAGGASTTATDVTVDVANPLPADIVVDAPVADEVVAGVTSLVSTVTLNDASTVTSVEYLVDGSVVGAATEQTGQYVYNLDTEAYADGTYSVVARVTTNAGLVTDSADVLFEIDNPDPVPPTATVTAPTAGATVAGDVTITADATDSDGTVTGVEFFFNGASVGTDTAAPYEVVVDTTTVADGTYDAYVVATDDDGQTTQSPAVSFDVDNPDPVPPTVDVIAPTAGQTVVGTVQITADASDSDGTVSSVEFFVDGNSVGTDTDAPYSVDFDTTTLTNGAYDVYAVATDDDSQTTQSATVSMNVDNPVPVAPEVSITSPTVAEVTQGTITATADATDADGDLASVEFFFNGSSVSTDTTSPYTADIDTTTVADGNYEVYAVATDAGGRSTTSATVTFEVDNPDPVAPEVSITSPAEGESVEGIITIAADATDADGDIVNVQFFLNGNLTSLDASAPYSFDLNTITVLNGNYTIYAVANDAGGRSTTSATVNFVVANPVPVSPEVTLTAPADGATVADTIAITADASDEDGTVSQVEFFVDGNSVGVDTTAPYSVDFDTTSIANGDYPVYAVARDNDGRTTQSSSATITIDNEVTAVPISLVQTAGGHQSASFPSAPTVGNIIVAVCYFGSNISDSAGNSYTEIAEEGGLTVQYAVVTNTSVGFNVDCNNWSSLAIHEFSGVDTTDPLDGAADTASVWGTSISADANVTSPGALVLESIAFSFGAGATFAGDTTLHQDEAGFWGVSTASSLAAAPGTFARTVTFDGTGGADYVVVTLKPSNSAPPVLQDPSVSITSPAGGATVEDLLTVNATATSNDHTQIDYVEFYIGSTLIVTDQTAPYAVNFDTNSVANGSHDLTAVAYTTGGRSTTSAAVTVNVDNDSTPPPPVQGPAVMPLISSNLPVFVSGGSGAANLNNPYTDEATNTAYDAFGNHDWRAGSQSGWAAYDLSSVPTTQRELVSLIWYNSSGTFECCASGGTSGVPEDYTIEANAAAGGSASAPTSGWVVLDTVLDNRPRAREHVIDLTGYNWVRINVTATTSGALSLQHMDIYDLVDATSPEDSWLFLGDSITNGALGSADVFFGSANNVTFSSLVNEVVPERFPAYINGGIVAVSTTYGVDNIDRILAQFPGRYVALAYGTNDAAYSTAADYRGWMTTLVTKVIAAGKVPVVSLVPWAESSGFNPGHDNTDISAGAIAGQNNELRALYNQFPEIMKGPDFERYFFDNPDQLNGDVHPIGHYRNMRSLWACQAMQSAYGIDNATLQASFCDEYLPYLQ